MLGDMCLLSPLRYVSIIIGIQERDKHRSGEGQINNRNAD